MSTRYISSFAVLAFLLISLTACPPSDNGSVGDAAKEAADKAVEAVNDAANTAGDAVKDAANSAGEAVNNAADSVSDTADNVVDKATDAIFSMSLINIGSFEIVNNSNQIKLFTDRDIDDC